MTEQEETKQERQEAGLYEKLASRTTELLDGSKKSLDEALKKAKEELSSAGDVSKDKADKIGGWVRRDLSQMGDYIIEKRDALTRAGEPDRMVAGMQSVFARLCSYAGETLKDLADKTEKSLEHKTGEITGPGTLTCKACGNEIYIKATGRIPPCYKCHKTVFRKSF